MLKTKCVDFKVLSERPWYGVQISVGYCGFHLTPGCHSAVQTLLLYSPSLCAFTWLRSVNDCSDKIFRLFFFFTEDLEKPMEKPQKEKEITMTCEKTKQKKIKNGPNTGPNARHRCCCFITTLSEHEDLLKQLTLSHFTILTAQCRAWAHCSRHRVPVQPLLAHYRRPGFLLHIWHIFWCRSRAPARAHIHADTTSKSDLKERKKTPHVSSRPLGIESRPLGRRWRRSIHLILMVC